MRAPPGLVTAALALWGHASGQWIVAIVLAVVIEAARWFPLRIAIGERGFSRLAIVTRIAFLSFLGVQVTQSPVPHALLAALTWSPLAFALVVVPQVYSETGLAPINVLRMFRAADRDRSGIDLTFPFFGITLLAAAGSANDVPFFYPALALVAGWGLALAAPRGIVTGRRFGRWAVWGGLYVAVIAGGVVTHTSLSALQHVLEEKALRLMDQWLQARTSSDRTRTRIGDLGRVKLSDKIVMRIDPEAPLMAPFYLRDGSFSRFEAGSWANRAIKGERFDLGSSAGIAEIIPKGATAPAGAATVTLRTRGQTVAMPLPAGTAAVHSEAGIHVSWNGRGMLLAEEPPAVLRYRAILDARAQSEAPPTEEDLAVPSMLRGVLGDVYAEAKLEGLSPAATLRAVREFFGQRFRYTLFLGDKESGTRTLNDFLLRDRAGHCEYFATAATLLLRRAGIPARYATGYSVEEWSELERQFVVRGLHGHAWTLAYVDGRWVEVDATPATWREVDRQAQRSVLDPVADLWALVTLRFEQWREAGAPVDRRTWIGLAIVVAIALGFQGARSVRRRRPFDPRKSGTGGTRIARSPFSHVEVHFTALGAARRPGQSLLAWIRELRDGGRVSPAAADALAALVARYYRTRFGPDTTAPETGSVRADANRWLEEHQHGKRDLAR